ncbi:MAG: alpha/beta-type small acid-soluble spore protein [Clostridia bacterium]
MKNLVPGAKDALRKFKMEAAQEVGVNLQDGGYNGNLTARENGSVGGQMVKKMIKSMEENMSNGSY